MINITVEELDIVVQASVEQALTEFKKIVPQLKKTIKQVEDGLNNVDTKGMTNKVQQAVQQVKQKVNEVKNTGIDKQLQAQFDRAGASVQKYQGQLEETKQKLRQVYAEMDNIQASTWKQYTPDGVELGNKAIEPSVNRDLEGNKEYQNLSKEATKLEQQITSINSKLNETKQQYNQIAGQIQQTTAKQTAWGNIVNKVKTAINGIKKNTNSTGNAFENVANISEKVRSGCNQILKITGKAVTKIKQMGTGFKQGLSHVLKYAGALFSLQSIYSTLSGSANSWLSSQNAGAQQLQANIDYLKNSFGSVLAPVIEYVVNLVYQLMKAIQSLVYALSGVNIFANASAKAYANMASSAKEANKETKQLSGIHSEINNIQSSDSNSGSGSGTVAPNMDLSQIDSQMSPLAKKLYDFFKPLVESWNIYGASLAEQVKTTASQIVALLSSVWGSFENIITNGTVYSILENILAIIDNIAQAWANALNYNNNGDAIVQNLANAFNNLLVAINNVVQSPEFQEWLNNCSDKFREISEKIASIDWQPLVDALVQIGSTLGTIALDVLSGLVDIFAWFVEHPTVAEIILGIALAISTLISVSQTLSSIITTVKAVVSGLSLVFSALTSPIGLVILAITALVAAGIYLYQNFETVRDVVSGAIETIKNTFINLYNEHIKPLIDNIVSLLQTLWNDVLQPLINWFVENVLPVLVPIFESLWNTISSVFGSIIDVISGVIETFKGVIEFIAGVFSGDWEKAWQGICDFFSGIWNTIKAIVETVWNAILGTITTTVNTIKGVITTVFNAIWTVIKNVINSILGGIESMANGIVSGINWVIRALNRLKFDIPDWVPGLGGKTFGFNISELSKVSLPRLAKGAVLKVPTVAEMAEYPGASQNPEIVTPQNIMEETFDRVLARYQDNDNSQPIYLTVNVGNKKLGQILLEDLRDKKRRSGKGIEALVGG